MIGREFFSFMTVLLVVATVSVAVAHGGESAKVIDAGANGFGNLIKAATLKA